MANVSPPSLGRRDQVAFANAPGIMEEVGYR